MSEEQFGELIPKGGGDPIPLLKKKLVMGRRETCDIVLRFGNVSGSHCELSLESGYWFVKDLNSRNGTRVNGYRITRRRIDPRDTLFVGKHQYEINYAPAELGAVGPPPDGGDLEDILGQSLMESAGLNHKARQTQDGRIGREQRRAAEPVEDDLSEEALQGTRPTDEAVADEGSPDEAAETPADEATRESSDSDYNLTPED